MIRLLVVVLALAFAPSMAQAHSGNTPGTFDFGVSASSLGAGGEIRYVITPWLAVRGNANGIGFVEATEIKGTLYDFDVKFGSVGLVVDIHPFAPGFRFSIGARYGFNEIELKTRPKECPSHDQCSVLDVVLGGDVTADVVQGSVFTYGEGSVRFNKLVPYAGIGYEGALYEPWGLRIGIDLGLAYQGKPKISYTPKGEAALLMDEEDIDERIRDIENQVKFLRFFPVVGLTLSRRF